MCMRCTATSVVNQCLTNTFQGLPKPRLCTTIGQFALAAAQQDELLFKNVEVIVFISLLSFDEKMSDLTIASS